MMTSKPRFTTPAALLLLFALLVGACDDDDDDPVIAPFPDADIGAAVTEVTCPDDPAAQVTMDELQFSPATTRVGDGEVVRWTNEDTVPHTVTSGDPGDVDAGQLFDSGTLNPGDSYCLRFNRAGDYDYYCELHPAQMDDGEVTAE